MRVVFISFFVLATIVVRSIHFFSFLSIFRPLVVYIIIFYSRRQRMCETYNI